MYSPAEKAGLPGCTGRGSSLLQHHYRHRGDMTPRSGPLPSETTTFLPSWRPSREELRGKVQPAADKVQISTCPLRKKSTLAVYAGA